MLTLHLRFDGLHVQCSGGIQMEGVSMLCSVCISSRRAAAPSHWEHTAGVGLTAVGRPLRQQMPCRMQGHACSRHRNQCDLLKDLFADTRLQYTVAFFCGLIQWRGPAGHKHECFPRQPFFHVDACNATCPPGLPVDVQRSFLDVPDALCANCRASRRQLRVACRQMAANKELQELIGFLNSPRQEVGRAGIACCVLHWA